MKSTFFWQSEEPSKEHPNGWINLVFRDGIGDTVIDHPLLGKKISQLVSADIAEAIRVVCPFEQERLAIAYQLHRRLAQRENRHTMAYIAGPEMTKAWVLAVALLNEQYSLERELTAQKTLAISALEKRFEKRRNEVGNEVKKAVRAYELERIKTILASVKPKYPVGIAVARWDLWNIDQTNSWVSFSERQHYYLHRYKQRSGDLGKIEIINEKSVHPGKAKKAAIGTVVVRQFLKNGRPSKTYSIFYDDSGWFPVGMDPNVEILAASYISELPGDTPTLESKRIFDNASLRRTDWHRIDV